MFTSIWDDIKREFNYGNMVTRIIIVNIAVFVFINLLWIIFRISNQWETPPIYNSIVHFFSLSSDWWHNLTHPWAFFTSMFLHEGAFHLLWNMLFLYWFGRIVGDFIGNQRILPLYLLGGLVGGMLYFVSANIFPYLGGSVSYALGASAAVMAIVVAAAVISPDYNMRLLFLGDVKLKYIVAALIFLDLVGMAGQNNTGGHFAHLGGAVFGWFFVKQLREDNDLSLPVNRLLDRINSFFSELFGQKVNKPKMAYKNPKVKTAQTINRMRFNRATRGHSVTDNEGLSHQEKVDAILDKIKRTGYDSLSSEEKQYLFNASKK